MSHPVFTLRPERATDSNAIESLAERSFGPGRFARTAHRIREQGQPAAGLSLAACAEDRLIGSIRFTPLAIGGKNGALLLGPLMVEDQWAGKGCGRALVREGLELAGERGYALVILVGDEPYYGQFGFAKIPSGQIMLPGPVDPHRLLALPLKEGALEEYSGSVIAERVS